MRKYLLLLIIIYCTGIKAQDEKKSHFFGINPAITVEPFYEKGELDVNIVPLVYQRTLTKRVDLRFTSIVNLGIRNAGNKISHYGFESALPVFIKKKLNPTDLSKGIYIGPIVSLTRNQLAKHNNAGLWLEGGFNLLFDDRVALMFGLQSGVTHFRFDSGENKWDSHLGLKFIIGKWF